jgi:DNA-binding response OmpR family regulator
MQLKRTFNFSSFTVLIHTQPEFVSSLVADMCRALRFKAVITRRDPAAAWDAFINNPVDIIFGDVASQDGLRLLRDARNTEISPNPHVPFVATAMTGSPARIACARDSGATEFLRFPLAAATLIERIIHIVEHPRVFVKAPQYTGPDRRRRRAEPPSDERRKQAPAPAGETAAGGDAEKEWKVQV